MSSQEVPASCTPPPARKHQHLGDTVGQGRADVWEGNKPEDYEAPGEKLQVDGYVCCLPGSALREFLTLIVIDVFLRPCKMA